MTFSRSIILLTLTTLVLASGCSDVAETPASAATATTRPTPVRTELASAAPFSSSISLPGQTRAATKVRVVAEASGRVVELDVVEGDALESGARLARLDARTDRTRVRQLASAHKQRGRELARLEQLQRSGLATDQDVERARANLDSASFELSLARQGVGRSTVSAPVAGVVEEVHVEVGSWVGAGSPVATVVDVDTIVVEVGLPERHVRALALGDRVKVHVHALELDVEGEVSQIALSADAGSRSFAVEVSVDNPNHLIKPGMQARVQVEVDAREAAVQLPRSAVMTRSKGHEVALVRDGRAHLQAVEIGPGLGDVVVVERGVEPGDVVVTVGQQLLREGQRVQLVGEPVASAP